MTDIARWHEFAYEQTDIPAGLTIRDWRTQRTGTRATSRPWAWILGALPRTARRPRRTTAGTRRAV
jgi:hypothetical protein